MQRYFCFYNSIQKDNSIDLCALGALSKNLSTDNDVRKEGVYVNHVKALPCNEFLITVKKNTFLIQFSGQFFNNMRYNVYSTKTTKS